jgi:hypothetical protein
MKNVENINEVIDVMESFLSAYLDNTRDYKYLFNATYENKWVDDVMDDPIVLKVADCIKRLRSE